MIESVPASASSLVHHGGHAVRESDPACDRARRVAIQGSCGARQKRRVPVLTRVPYRSAPLALLRGEPSCELEDDRMVILAQLSKILHFHATAWAGAAGSSWSELNLKRQMYSPVWSKNSNAIMPPRAHSISAGRPSARGIAPFPASNSSVEEAKRKAASCPCPGDFALGDSEVR